jgi:hydrophobic/amphiphilic exporter-1 (mainly G- bacteria), HAE1 family
MNWLPAFSLRKPVTVIMLFIALCVLGVIAYTRISLSLLPTQFDSNSLWVFVPYTEAQPLEVEEKVILPIEERVSDLEGLKSIESHARMGRAEFSFEFHRSISNENANNGIADRLDRAMTVMPDGVDEYYIWNWSASDIPVMYLAASVDKNPQVAYEQLDRIQRRIERIPGVGGVNAWGVDSKEVIIGFKRDALMSNRLNVYDIISRMRQDNFQLPSGKVIEDGKVTYLRSISKHEGVKSISAFPIRDGLRLDSIAEIQYGLLRSSSINRMNGGEGAGISIRKESSANTIDTSLGILETLDDMKASGRYGAFDFFVFFNQGEEIAGALDNLLYSALFGGFFAIIVLFIFVRSTPLTLLIAACIPFSLMISVSIMYLSGLSLNLLSLMGLMIAVGMVVDNAIVVVESIYSKRIDGENSKNAAISGASEVALPIALSTLTSIAVFGPVIILNQESEASLFLQELGLPIIFALLASLLVALAFTPLTTTLLKDDKPPVTAPWITWLITRYRKVLNWTLQRKSDATMILIAILALTIALPIQSVEFDAEGQKGAMDTFTIRYEAPPQYNFSERNELVDTIEAFVEESKEKWGVKTYRSRLNGDSSLGGTNLYLSAEKDRTMTLEEITNDAKARMPEVPGVRMFLEYNEGDENNSFDIYLRGESSSELKNISTQLIPFLENTPGVLSVKPSQEDSNIPEFQLVIDRDECAKYGISATTVGYTVATVLGSNSLPDQRIDDQDVGVTARFRYSDRSNLDRLLQFPVYSQAANTVVPLEQLVNVKTAPSVQFVTRYNRKTAFPLTISISPEAEMKDVRESINSTLEYFQFPTGYGFDPPFNMEDLEDLETMVLALFMSIMLVFLIMSALFESLILPLSIVTAIPMAGLGAYWSLYLSNTNLDSMGLIGLIILVGVVVNNGIVMIELVTTLRKSGMPRRQALINAGARRLRPILMTAVTTIIGLMPMALGEAAIFGIPYAPMGRVVAGGLAAGTILTLFYVPLLYAVLDDMRQGTIQKIGWAIGREHPTEAK